MSLLIRCMLILFLCSGSEEFMVQIRPASTAFLRWHLYKMEKGQNFVRNIKRHSDGTFSSDFSHYLDKMKAKNFVDWLASMKQGCEGAVQPIADV